MKNIVISLFDYTGNMLYPWRDAGYRCFAFDLQHNGINTKDGITWVQKDLTGFDSYMDLGIPFNVDDVAMVFAFPPCDHLAVSGARWFKGKGLRKLSKAIDLFASACDICESFDDVPYMIENPVSTISTYWRKPDCSFHPWQFSRYCKDDNYTKKTCLWVGNGFVMPPMQKNPDSKHDDRIHKAAPGPNRKNVRSATPMGFARAVFQVNGKKL